MENRVDKLRRTRKKEEGAEQELYPFQWKALTGITLLIKYNIHPYTVIAT